MSWLGLWFYSLTYDMFSDFNTHAWGCSSVEHMKTKRHKVEVKKHLLARPTLFFAHVVSTAFLPVRFLFPNIFPFILTYFALFYFILQYFIAVCFLYMFSWNDICYPMSSVNISSIKNGVFLFPFLRWIFFKMHWRPFFVLENLKYF